MRRPVIGIASDHEADPARAVLRDAYYEAVFAAGGLPLVLPPVVEAGFADAVLERVDGLVLPGGDDPHPALWGDEEVHPACTLLTPRRQAFDLAVVGAALERRLPLLAICCGMQMLNVACGGSIVQDLPSMRPGGVVHKAGPGAPPARHEVRVEPGSRLQDVLGGRERIEVNSLHHQGCGRIGDGLRVAAAAPDGVVEAIEGTDGVLRFGVQWHPEKLIEAPAHRALFEALIAEAVARGADA